MDASNNEWSERDPALHASSRVGLLDPRLAFLTALALAPLYAVFDMAQRFTTGPDTVFSNFFKLPAAVHLLAFVGVYAGVWLAWLIVLRLGSGRGRVPLARLTEVHAARTLLNVYLAVVLGIAALVVLRQGFTLGLAAQTLLLLFTYAYCEVAWHATQPR
jgi:hypothetical protein